MKGLYDKYIITKSSGKPLAEGFYAIVVNACRAGALAFAEAVRVVNPQLANDIQNKITREFVDEK